MKLLKTLKNKQMFINYMCYIDKHLFNYIGNKDFHIW
jgi:hypothetical protein